MNKYCVDASVVIKWLVEEEESLEAEELLKKWLSENSQFIAPSLLDYEVGTTLLQKLRRQFITSSEYHTAIENYYKLNFLLYHVTQMVQKNAPIAEILEVPTVYDVSYLVLAQQQNCIFVTADQKFYRKASPFYSDVRYFKDCL